MWLVFFFTSLLPLLFLPATYDALLLLLLPSSPSIVFAESSFQKKEFLAVVVVVALDFVLRRFSVGVPTRPSSPKFSGVKNHGKFKFYCIVGNST